MKITAYMKCIEKNTMVPDTAISQVTSSAVRRNRRMPKISFCTHLLGQETKNQTNAVKEKLHIE